MGYRVLSAERARLVFAQVAVYLIDSEARERGGENRVLHDDAEDIGVRLRGVVVHVGELLGGHGVQIDVREALVGGVIFFLHLLQERLRELCAIRLAELSISLNGRMHIGHFGLLFALRDAHRWRRADSIAR